MSPNRCRGCSALYRRMAREGQSLLNSSLQSTSRHEALWLLLQSLPNVRRDETIAVESVGTTTMNQTSTPERAPDLSGLLTLPGLLHSVGQGGLRVVIECYRPDHQNRARALLRRSAPITQLRTAQAFDTHELRFRTGCRHILARPGAPIAKWRLGENAELAPVDYGARLSLGSKSPSGVRGPQTRSRGDEIRQRVFLFLGEIERGTRQEPPALVL